MNVLKRTLEAHEAIITIGGEAWVFVQTHTTQRRLNPKKGTVQGTAYKIGRRGRLIGAEHRVCQWTDGDGNVRTPWKTDGKVFIRCR